MFSELTVLTFAVIMTSVISVPLRITPRYVRTIEFTTPNELESEKEQHKPYEFSFSVRDDLGTKQHRQEIANSEGVVKGSYGYLDPDGVYRFVDYTADGDGYRAKLRNIKLTASAAIDVRERPPINLSSGTKFNVEDYLVNKNNEVNK